MGWGHTRGRGVFVDCRQRSSPGRFAHGGVVSTQCEALSGYDVGMNGRFRSRDAARLNVWMWALVYGCLLGGCPGEDPVAGAELTLGTGEARFEVVGPGAELPLVAGSQGGFHVWLSMRVRGLTGTRLTMRLELLPEGPGEDAFSNVSIGFDQVEGERGMLEHVGWPARVLQPWCAVDRPLLVRVTLRDTAGGEVSAMQEIVPTPPPGGFDQSCEEVP